MKLIDRTRLSRAAFPALLALLFAGSAAASVASALELAIPALPLYLAAALAALLCAVGAGSARGATFAAVGLVVAAGGYVAGHMDGVMALRALFASWSGRGADAAQVLLGGRMLLTCGSFALAALFFALLNRREFVSMAMMLLLAALVCCHAMSASTSLAASAPGLIAVAAAFALTGGIQREPQALRVLVPAAVALALAVALAPTGRVTWPPLENAANRVRDIFEQYFRFTHERLAFSISEQGYDHAGQIGDSVVSMLGGPARPRTDPVMRVETDADVLLRGAIRTAYTGYSWVDAAPKNRYLYFDITHRAVRDRVFTPPAPLRRALLSVDVSVEMLDKGTSTLFVPGLLEKFDMDLSTAVYYNTEGEMFLSREVQAGDRYTLRALLPEFTDVLRQVARAGEEVNDDLYQEILANHTQLPEGIDGGVYALTMQITGEAKTAWDRAEAILNFLRRNMRYTLEPEVPPAGRDFVSHFLMDTQRGYCSYYATAMAVMGRIAGLPTRYVEGYLARPGLESLNGENAHAWAEVYFRGVGWIPFDATGGVTGSGWRSPDDGGAQGQDGNDGTEGAASTDAEGDLAGLAPTPTPEVPGGGEETPTPAPNEPEPNEPEPDETESDVPGDGADEPGDDLSESGRSMAWLAWLLGILLLMVAACFGLWATRRLRRSDPALLCREAQTAREATLILYRANLTLLAHLGMTPGGGEAPASFARRAAEQFKNPHYAPFVEAVTAASYGRQPASRADVQRGLRAYDSFKVCLSRRERLRFIRTRIFHGLGSYDAIP